MGPCSWEPAQWRWLDCWAGPPSGPWDPIPLGWDLTGSARRSTTTRAFSHQHFLTPFSVCYLKLAAHNAPPPAFSDQFLGENLTEDVCSRGLSVNAKESPWGVLRPGTEQAVGFGQGAGDENGEQNPFALPTVEPQFCPDATSPGCSPWPRAGLWEARREGSPAITQPGLTQVSSVSLDSWMAAGKGSVSIRGGGTGGGRWAPATPS